MNGDGELREDLARRVTMHRRKFLGLMAAGTGAAFLAACGSSDSDGAGTTLAATTSTVPKVPAAQGLKADPFTLGIASGDPLPGSVILWTRLAPDPLALDGAGGMAGDDVRVLWEVATDEAFTEVVASGIEVASAEFGHSIHAEPTGLTPDSWYWYRFRIGSFTSPIGRTRTTPADDATVEKLVMAFASCQLLLRGKWAAYDHLVADKPDLVLHLGDYIYEYPGGKDGRVIPLESEPANIADYRVLYAAYKSDPKLQAAHAIAPWMVTGDDHEVENNYADETPEDAENTATFPERRKAAYQAMWEHQPVRLTPPGADGSMQIYRRVRYGRLADFFVLDGRQYRTDQPCGDEPGVVADECAGLDDERHTMLGMKQEAWLEKGLKNTKATWPVLAQQTIMKAFVVGDRVLNVDQWDGYPAARRRLLNGIKDEGVENVMVLSGDFHSGFAADLRAPGAGTDGDIVAHEIVGPAISSAGNSKVGEALAGAGLGLLYANGSDNGYVRCTITPATWTSEFVVVDDVENPDSDAHVDATVQVKAGTPGLTVL